ncbi:Protein INAPERTURATE POLLEN1 [Zea mays]|uniref:Protein INAPERTURATE POLLEN1 n=1 Tax=Zea mays TaxID=4577 RepID=A0A1D6I9C1_MAIZE|nr:Protein INAPERTURATE POLLEN1 [Zea mays]
MTECSIPSSDGATHLPPLSSAAAAVEAHFQAHWSALDAAARQDPARVIAVGDWRSPLELPFLWLGDVPWCRLRQVCPSLFHPMAESSISQSIDALRPSLSPQRPRLHQGSPEVSVRLQVHQFGLICDNLDAVNKFEPNYRLIRRLVYYMLEW